MDRKKKVILSGLAMTLVAGATTGAALAYLTDGETAENTFTIGDVSIEGIEPNYPGNDSDDVQDIVPNKEVNKDPQIDNDGVNDAIVFMTVDSPMEYVTVVGDNGVVQTARSVNEIFWFKDSEDPQSTHENNFDENWQELSAKEMYVKIAADGTETKLVETSQEALKATYDALQPGESLVKRYVFGYKTAIQGSSEHDGTPQTPENKLTSALFDKVQLKNVIENEIDEAVEKIVVKSYAIQATNILENSVDLGTNLNETNLGKIYDIFVRQNSEGNDASGTKLNDMRDIDLLTPTENGASGTTDPHKNRFGTDSNVSSPNNINPSGGGSEGGGDQVEPQYNGIYGDWYADAGIFVLHYTFNQDGTYSTEPAIGSGSGTFTDDGSTLVLTSAATGKEAISQIIIPYTLNADATVMTDTSTGQIFTRTAPVTPEPLDLSEYIGEYVYEDNGLELRVLIESSGDEYDTISYEITVLYDGKLHFQSWDASDTDFVDDGNGLTLNGYPLTKVSDGTLKKVEVNAPYEGYEEQLTFLFKDGETVGMLPYDIYEDYERTIPVSSSTLLTDGMWLYGVEQQDETNDG